MRIGISISSSHPGNDPREGARHMIERARAAARSDLDTLFIGDHHVTPFPYFQNTPMLGRMLAEWNENPFGALYLLPLWHPVILAEQIGTLAALAPGRFIMQCGLGDDRQGAALGVDMSRRVAMFEASLAVMRALWRGEAVSENRFWGLDDARTSPVPSEPVEVWVGALAPAAIRRTARLAEGWLAAPSLTLAEAREAILLYREACTEFEREPTAVAIRRDILIAEDPAAADAAMAAYLAAGYRGINPEALMYGSPEQVAEQVVALRDAGFTDLCVRNISARQEEAVATIERLAEVRSRIGDD